MLLRFSLIHFNLENTMIRNTMIRRTQLAPIVIALGLVSGSAHAALQGRDLNGSAGSFEAYYDTDLNITWLADANVNGSMTWADANTWAANLSFTDGVSVYDNWRLPTALNQEGTGPCNTYNCTSTEMGHLFYDELGGTAGQSILTSGDPDLVKFTNLQAGSGYYGYYWSGTEYAPNSGAALLFYFSGGGQGAAGKDYGLHALAVSPGDVGNVAAVPEADTWAMLLVGLGLVGAVTRRRGG